MSFQDDLMRADAIREVRASGCTHEGIAELIVDFHGAVHVLTNVPKIQKLGEEVAASDSEQGAKMRQLLHEAASKAEAAAVQQKAASATPANPAQIAANVEKEVHDAQHSSKPADSEAAADASAGIDAGSVSAAAASAGASGEAPAAEPGPGAAPETSVAQGEGQAQGS